MKTLNNISLSNKRVLIRADLNVPMKDGKVVSDQRIISTVPTIQHCLDCGAKVILMSHLGRPKEGVVDHHFSLQPVADYISNLFNQPIPLVTDWKNSDQKDWGNLVLLENVRFCIGETDNDDALSQQLANLCDVFVMDAFASAHRAHASTHGVAKYAEQVCAGFLLKKELDALKQIFDQPQSPLLALIGGSKVSTKLAVLESLSDKVDTLIVGGGIANTFLSAAGFEIGKSIVEQSLLPLAERLIQKMIRRRAKMPLPVDVVVVNDLEAPETATVKTSDAVDKKDIIVDIGPQTVDLFCSLIAEANTIVWNGPVGIFEVEAFAKGTKKITHEIAKSNAFSIAGGGDTIAALEAFSQLDQVSYVSTGGGAFLEFLEGKVLPAVHLLEQRSLDHS